jgi:hypothetical protein
MGKSNSIKQNSYKNLLMFDKAIEFCDNKVAIKSVRGTSPMTTQQPAEGSKVLKLADRTQPNTTWIPYRQR